MKKLSVLSASVVFCFCASVFAADISGDWTIEFTDIMGHQKWDVNFKVTGEDLDVTVKNSQSNELKGTGTLKSDQIAFTITQKGGGGDMFVDFKGTVKGNKMEGTREVYADPNGEGYIGGARPGSEGESGQSSGGRGAPPTGSQGRASGDAGARAGGAPSGGQDGAPGDNSARAGGPPGGQDGAQSAGGGRAGGSPQGSDSASSEDNLSANTWTGIKK